jgi:hypothetical protein
MRQLPTECGVGHVTILRLAQKILLTDRSPRDYAKFRSRSHDAVIRVCDEGFCLISPERKGDMSMTIK